MSDFTIEMARRNRIASETRKSYRSGVRQIMKWMNLNSMDELLIPCPNNNSEKTIDLTRFTYKNFLDFLVWCVNNREAQISTLNGYRSAIRSLYKDQRLDIPIEFGEDIREVFSGKYI